MVVITLRSLSSAYVRSAVYTVHGHTDRRYTPHISRSLSASNIESQWFRNYGYLMGGRYTSLDDFIRAEWEGGYLGTWDAHDMLTLLQTWYSGDISGVTTLASSARGSLVDVLGSIGVKSLIMPCKTDLYFPVRAPAQL